MRLMLVGALTVMLAAPTVAQAAIPADTYADRVGVNVHTPYLTSQHPTYGYGDRIVTALNQAGIKHVRDGMTKASPPPHFHWTKLQYVASHVGGSIDLILDCKSWYCDYSAPNFNAEQALGWIETYMPATESVEGENEADNPGVGGSGAAAATTRQQKILAAMRADPWFDGKPLLAPSFITAANYQTVQAADACNGHPYPGGNPDTEARMAGQIAMCRQQAPGKPVYFTEYGFPHTAPNPCTGQRGVTDAEAATWLPTSLLLAAKLGVARTYLYELSDSNSCKWGLFTRDGAARPEVAVLKNWMTLLADTGSPTVPNTALTISDPAGAGKLGVVQFAKADGSYWAAVYPTVYGVGSRTVTFSRPAGSTYSLQYHQPWKDTAARGYVTNRDSISVPVEGDSPFLLRVRPK